MALAKSSFAIAASGNLNASTESTGRQGFSHCSIGAPDFDTAPSHGSDLLQKDNMLPDTDQMHSGTMGRPGIAGSAGNL